MYAKSSLLPAFVNIIPLDSHDHSSLYCIWLLLPATVAKLSRCNRDCLACSTRNMYCLGLDRESLLTSILTYWEIIESKGYVLLFLGSAPMLVLIWTQSMNVRVLMCVRHCSRCWWYLPQRAKQSLCPPRTWYSSGGAMGRDGAVNKLIDYVGECYGRKQMEMGKTGCRMGKWVVTVGIGEFISCGFTKKVTSRESFQWLCQGETGRAWCVWEIARRLCAQSKRRAGVGGNEVTIWVCVFWGWFYSVNFSRSEMGETPGGLSRGEAGSVMC